MLSNNNYPLHNPAGIVPLAVAEVDVTVTVKALSVPDVLQLGGALMLKGSDDTTAPAIVAMGLDDPELTPNCITAADKTAPTIPSATAASA
jgi:hypothetical protein